MIHSGKQSRMGSPCWVVVSSMGSSSWALTPSLKLLFGPNNTILFPNTLTHTFPYNWCVELETHSNLKDVEDFKSGTPLKKSPDPLSSDLFHVHNATLQILGSLFKCIQSYHAFFFFFFLEPWFLIPLHFYLLVIRFTWTLFISHLFLWYWDLDSNQIINMNKNSWSR